MKLSITNYNTYCRWSTDKSECVHISHLTSSQLTSFHPCAVKLPSLPWLQPIRTK